MNRGRLLKKQATIFSVELEDGKILECVARKNLKKDGLFVGDFVFVDEYNSICKLDKRKNILIRPPVANIDKMFIVVAPIPKPDLYTVDKMLLFCAVNDIVPVVCINKKDLDEQYCKKIESVYKKIAKTVIISTKDSSFEKLKKLIDGVCVLAGQSAVGKSSIINALKESEVAKVDTFSKKVERGKQTTRTVELYQFGQNRYLADTAGFSKLDESLLNLEVNEVKSYYPEFLEFAQNCKYKSCLHTNDRDCAVCKALKNGEISQERYQNYKKLIEVLQSLKKF